MPSPFPGMDPYLEGELWSSFHVQFAVEIIRTLNPQLTPRYVALAEKYQNAIRPEDLGVTIGHESVYPDVAVSQAPGKRGAKGAADTAPFDTPLKLQTIVNIPI